MTVDRQRHMLSLRGLLDEINEQAGCEVELCVHLQHNISKFMCRNELCIYNTTHKQHDCEASARHPPATTTSSKNQPASRLRDRAVRASPTQPFKIRVRICLSVTLFVSACLCHSRYVSYPCICQSLSVSPCPNGIQFRGKCNVSRKIGVRKSYIKLIMACAAPS